MKKKLYILIPVILLAIFFQNSYAQRIKGAIIVGANLSQVDGDQIYGFNKLGSNLGAAAIVPFAKKFSFSIETVFSQKGAYQRQQYEVVDSLGNKFTKEYKLKLNYLEVPFLVHYTDNEIITAGIGFSYGRLVGIKEYEHGKLVDTTTLNGGPYSRDDYNVLVELHFRLHKKIPRFRFNIRYAYSMANIRTRDFFDTNGEYSNTRKQYNNVISFRLIYVFNKKAMVADRSRVGG